MQRCLIVLIENKDIVDELGVSKHEAQRLSVVKLGTDMKGRVAILILEFIVAVRVGRQGLHTLHVVQEKR